MRVENVDPPVKQFYVLSRLFLFDSEQSAAFKLNIY